MVVLKHYGVAKRSGRYPYDPSLHPPLHKKVYELSDKHSEKAISEKLGIPISRVRAIKSSNAEEFRKHRLMLIEEALKKNPSLTPTELSKLLNIPRTTIISLRNNNVKDSDVKKIKDKIKNIIEDQNNPVDIGYGTSQLLGIKETDFNKAVNELLNDGYYLHKVPYTHNNGKTTIHQVISNKSKLERIDVDNSTPLINDDTSTKQLMNVKGISSKHVKVSYESPSDGMVEVGSGYDIGGKYAQVRIAVDGTHYIKGMAVYNHELKPNEVLVHTNKSKLAGKDCKDVLKEMKKDAFNPFESNISETRGAINILYKEGDWSTWSTDSSMQFLSKQKPKTAASLLKATNKTLDNRMNNINSISFAPLREYRMKQEAEALESRMVKLPMKAIHKSSFNVILNDESLKGGQVYSTQHPPGSKLALVRFPHAGTFEIVDATVVTPSHMVKKYGHLTDGIVINSKAAAKLSGADFDGDAVLTLPNNSNNILHTKSMKEFNPKIYYNKEYEKYTPVQLKMLRDNNIGTITNLITDMSLQKAPAKEIERMVKCSMVAVDLYKHKLDINKAKADFGYHDLRSKYKKTMLTKLNGLKRKGKDFKELDVDKLRGTNNKIEDIYISYLKSLQKRVKNINLDETKYVSSRVSAQSVKRSILSKINIVESQKPYERLIQRKAQVFARSRSNTTKYAESLNQFVIKERRKNLFKKINLSKEEWIVLRSNGLSKNILQKVLRYANMEELLHLDKTVKTTTQDIISFKGKKSAEEVAKNLGVSVSFVYEIWR